MFEVLRIFILVALLTHPPGAVVPVVEAYAPFDAGSANAYPKRTRPDSGKAPAARNADNEGDFPCDDKSYTAFRWFFCEQTCSFPQSKQCDRMVCSITPFSRFMPDVFVVAGQPRDRVSPKLFLSLSSSPRSPPPVHG